MNLGFYLVEQSGPTMVRDTALPLGSNRMCGRYTLRTPLKRVAELFDAHPTGDWHQPPRFNVAPSQVVAVVRMNAESGQRELVGLNWGLVPHWAKDATIGNRMINARAETVASKPSFREAFRRHRCLVIADGFYEWQKDAGGSKQPFYIRLKEDRPFAFAGLWARADKLETPIETCTIVTTNANDVIRPIHPRMPVILDNDACQTWLSADKDEADRLQELLRPYPAGPMIASPVSTIVNSPRNDGPECIESAAAGGKQGSLFD